MRICLIGGENNGVYIHIDSLTDVIYMKDGAYHKSDFTDSSGRAVYLFDDIYF